MPQSMTHTNRLPQPETTTTLPLLLFLLLLNLLSFVVGVDDDNTTADYTHSSYNATTYLDVCYTFLSRYSNVV
ncbi:unnamed protein product [Linum trigynum]|uniref:Uncharacterized protein n=1 Tax=Linum trigynum TaxID=586398 RepID=A0AAV2FWF0_9ROSI